VPTYDQTDQFKRDLATLSADERKAFKRAVEKFIEDLRSGKFRRGLRVKGVQGADGVFEMTWAGNDGRATFQYGPELRPGEPHVIWRRCGGHEIFSRP
jgi:hypothetical protein